MSVSCILVVDNDYDTCVFISDVLSELRCVYLTRQWDSYVAYRVERATECLYPHRDTLLPTIRWSVAA